MRRVAPEARVWRPFRTRRFAVGAPARPVGSTADTEAVRAAIARGRLTVDAPVSLAARA